MMEYESRISPVLGHLAWLAERIDSKANRGRAYDAAVLTYNAAAMLQWHFVLPVSYADVIRDAGQRAEAAGLIDSLVTTARKLVTEAKDAPGKTDDEIRERLRKLIDKTIEKLRRLFLALTPEPERVPELEEFSSLRALMDAFLDAHKEDFGPAIAKGRALGSKVGTGPEAALDEAVAGLVYVHEPGTKTTANPKDQRALAQMAAGFFKTAVDIQPDELSGRERKWWRKMADTLVAEAEQDRGK